MIRKSLFWGLTLVLVTALVSLTLRGRRLEKQQSSRAVEIVRPSKTTSTRVLMPQDLEIAQSRMQLEESTGGNAKFRIARHTIEIRNNGKVPYCRIQLGFDYLNRNGKPLTTRTQSVSRIILPGTSLKPVDITLDGLPASTANFRVTIVYADIGSALMSPE